ncbi:MAG TPA: flagellar basal body protein [Clostridia bacterium]|nr:flagellar basal body protein [Clostridia bacterium]
MFTAKSAVIAQQRRLDTIANNLANINTRRL